MYFIKCYWILYLVSRLIFFFSFGSDFNLEATVVKTGEIRGLKQLFPSYFLLIEEKSKIIITA